MSNEPFPVSTYFSVWQLRADGWAWLEGATKRLLETDPQHGELEALTRDVGSLLDLLEPIERYWAFPGRLEFAQLRRLLDNGEREQLSKAVARIDRALVNDSYHSGDGEDGEEPAEERLTLLGRQRRRPHFEVLVIDDESRRGQDAVRDNLARLRRPDDEFTYDLVLVSSFEEALISALLNVNLQACVVGSGFTLRSRHDLGVLGQFLAGIEEEGLDELSMTTRALRLGARINALREIHGYRAQEGLRVFREEALSAPSPALAEVAASTVGSGSAPLAGSAARRAPIAQPDDTTGGEIP